jgi:hypothetical protein
MAAVQAERGAAWVTDDILATAIDEWLLQEWHKNSSLLREQLFERFVDDFRFAREHLPARATDADSLFRAQANLLGRQGHGYRQRRLEQHQQRIAAVREQVSAQHAFGPNVDELLVDWMRRRQGHYVVVSKAKLTRMEHQAEALHERLDNLENVPPPLNPPAGPSRYDERVRAELHQAKHDRKRAFVIKHDAATKAKVRALVIDAHVSFERVPEVIALVISMLADDEQQREALKSIPSASTARNWDRELAIAEQAQLRHELEEVQVIHASSDASTKGHDSAYAIAVTFYHNGPQRRLLTTAPILSERAGALADRVTEVLNDSGAPEYSFWHGVVLTRLTVFFFCRCAD